MDPYVAIGILVVLLVLSAIFSSAETALTTVNKIRMRTLADDNNKSAKRVIKLIEDPQKMLSAILIGNNIVNIAASSLTTTLAIEHFKNIKVGLATGILTLIILIFGEIIPKTLATIYSERLSLTYSWFIYWLTKLLSIVIKLITVISYAVLKLFHIDPNAHVTPITEDELLTIVEVSHEEGVIESEERKMITNVVDFGDSLVKDVCVPRVDMAFASLDLTYDELVTSFSVDKYSRLPVYDESRDNVIGIVNLKDVFFYQGKKEEFSIKKILREPYFTYEFKKTSELLIEMRKAHISLAIVLDEYGATTGLITLEDLIEEIVGEIRDEYDEDEEDSVQQVGENEYVVNGNTKLEEINEEIGLHLESDDYDSIAGHIIYLLDHLPDEGETITSENVTYTVDAVDKNRIDKVHITVLPESDMEEDSVEA